LGGTECAVATPQKGLAVIQGLITSKDVLWNGRSIVRGYGLRQYVRCLCAVLSRRRTTFLELIWAA